MLLCARLIEIQQEDLYAMEYMDYRESKSFLSMQDVLAEDPIEDFTELFAKYPRQYKRVLNGDINRFGRPRPITDKQVIAMEIAHENQSRCQKLIFSIIHDNINGWWD
jgi:hypothetical protein